MTKWIEYEYDPSNRLVRRTIDPDGSGGAGEIDTFFAGYVGLNPTLEFDADDDDVSHRYLWGAGFDMLLADEQISSVNSAGNTLWPLSDHLGTIRDIADYDEGDPEFEITNHRVYDSFGRLESETNSAVDLAFGFTGKYTDPDTGYTQHLFRWYDPSTGRWLIDDPLGFAAGDSNLSRYVGNDSVRNVDPFGLFELGQGYDGFAATETAARLAARNQDQDGGIAGIASQIQDDNPYDKVGEWPLDNAGEARAFFQGLLGFEDPLDVPYDILSRGCVGLNAIRIGPDPQTKRHGLGGAITRDGVQWFGTEDAARDALCESAKDGEAYLLIAFQFPPKPGTELPADNAPIPDVSRFVDLANAGDFNVATFIDGIDTDYWEYLSNGFALGFDPPPIVVHSPSLPEYDDWVTAYGVAKVVK